MIIKWGSQYGFSIFQRLQHRPMMKTVVTADMEDW